MELLDIYQDLLTAHIQTPKSVEPAADELPDRANDRTLVQSLMERLMEHSPPEPGTSQSHATGAGLQESNAHYRRAVSQFAAVLENTHAAMQHHGPSSSQSAAEQQTLPSPLEWAAFTRECVSTLQHESHVH